MTHHTDAERAEFEAWCDKNEYDRVERLDGSGYNNEKTKRAWLAWQAARRAPAVPVPQSIEQMAVDRYKVVPSHESMFHCWAVVAGNGTQQLYIGREVECLNMARKFAGAFLDGAFVAMQNTDPAHPAEGVPAPVAVAVPDSAAYPNPDEIRAIARSVSTGASDSPSPSEYVMAGYRAALAATPAAPVKEE